MRDDARPVPVVAAERRRLALIFNPTAGRRRRRRFAVALDRLSAGATVRVMPTEARGDAERFAAQIAADGSADAIVAAGGDGTINEVINGMAGSSLPLGIVPLGTANVLAWELGIGDKPQAAAAAILGGATRAIHLGRCNGRYFSMMAGVGLDAHVVANIQPAVKRALGKLAYVHQGLVQIARLQATRYRVVVDGVAAEAASVIIANGRYYAGRYVVAGAADLGRPELHACLFGRGGRVSAMRYSLAMLVDRLQRLPDLVVQPGARITIDGPAGEPIQGDGDIIGRLPAAIELAPATLDMFVLR
ncbi:MAG: diacylglycerol kinase family lipid kinase [Alphaproteobacteria bacterium]|nr:diacylglycerol kinase family lipid kinase [Alphaproteobacteria bacterium]